MNSFLPNWLIDIASISSILGILITIFLLLEARKIRNSFLSRARLPEVTQDIFRAHKKLSECLKDWPSEEKNAIEQLIITKELLYNLYPKLPNPEKNKVSSLINSLETKKWIIIKIPIKNINEDEVWEHYQNISGVLTSLKQLQKDLKWN